MLKLILGNGKSGKSYHIYEEIKKDAALGKEVFLIVPEQQTVQCEQAVLNILPPAAQLTTETLNFSRLANLVFRKLGGLSYNYADKGSKTLVMWKNLRDLAPLLKEYGTAAGGHRALSFSKEMLAAVSELKAYRVSPQKLENAAEKLEGNDILKRKLIDLSLIYSAYSSSLSESYSDSADDLSKLAEKLSGSDFFVGKKVYIDSFTSFTAQEYEVISHIMRSADQVTVTLTLDSLSSSNIHYESTADTAFRLLSIARRLSVETQCVTLTDPEESPSPLSVIRSSLWRPDVKDVETNTNGIISLISAKDPYEEAEAAAMTVRRLMQSGYRCHEISVIARDASAYRGVIDVALEKAEIPYFFSQPSDILSKPLIKFILSALRIKLYNWRTADIMTFLRSGLGGFDTEQTDLFECYCSVWRLSGASRFAEKFAMNPDGYSGYMTEHGEDVLRKVNVLRERLVSVLSPLFTRLDMAETAADMCRALYIFTEDNGISDKLSARASAEYARGRRRDAYELVQLYNATVKALENIATSLGDEPCSVSEFFDALNIMFENVSVNTIPTAKDQVTVGSASMLRADGIKCAVVIGLNEGEFPQNIKESGLFSSNDKRLLDSVGISLSPDTSTKAADELFFIYRAMSLPTEKLFLIYHENDPSGAASIPSTAITRLKNIFPSLQTESYSDLPLSERILAPAFAFEKLTTNSTDVLGKAYRQFADTVPELKTRINLSDIPIENRLCQLPESTSSAPLYLTQSIIGDYVNCPFEYMCKRLLSLSEVSAAVFDYSDFGTYIHYVLEHYLRRAVSDGVIGDPPDSEYISSVIAECADEYILRSFSGGEADSGRLRHRFARMRRLAEFVSYSITNEFAESSFRPEFFELSVGSRHSEHSLSPLMIPTSMKKDIMFCGKIDRIDVWRDDAEKAYIRVIDYKSGKKKFSFDDIEKGEGLQLPLYLFALCDREKTDLANMINAGGEIIPAGAMYLSTLIPQIDVSDGTDILKKAESSISRSGFIVNEPHILGAMSHSLSPTYLCGAKSGKSKVLSGDALVSAEGMEQLKSTLIYTVTSIGENIISGRMSCAPSVSDGVIRCERCPMRQICRSASHFTK